jgi:RNA polymerase sigma factor (sigma-70 family)
LTVDILTKIIKDLEDGIITEQYALDMMNFTARQEDVKSNQSQNVVRRYIIKDYINLYGKTPEEILCERERTDEIVDAYNYITSLLSDNAKVIWELHILKGYTQKEIADYIGIKQQTVCRYLNRIKSRLNKKGVRKTLEKHYIYSLIRHSSLKAHAPSSYGYPYEFLMRVNGGGQWQSHLGNKIYKSKTICILSNYFSQSFHDDKTCCSLCNKMCGGKNI